MVNYRWPWQKRRQGDIWLFTLITTTFIIQGSVVQNKDAVDWTMFGEQLFQKLEKKTDRKFLMQRAKLRRNKLYVETFSEKTRLKF